ncbi:CCE_0567 family metalloprotein [Anabaena sp. CCY 0017]|uniref:CCE_0567 family metalloprotein n=1 Tax=Anabaena sp. CCY 0017 TaxID=3103866 RepID=UPI0039C6DFF3
MAQVSETSIEEIKTKIKRLNSKAGQMKMDLHDLAEGLPTDYKTLMDVAAATYQIYQQLDELKQQLKTMEKVQ